MRDVLCGEHTERLKTIFAKFRRNMKRNFWNSRCFCTVQKALESQVNILILKREEAKNERGKSAQIAIRKLFSTNFDLLYLRAPA